MRLLKFAMVIVLTFYAVTIAVLYPAQESFIFPAPKISVDVKDDDTFKRVMLPTPDGEKLFSLHHPAENGEKTILVFHGNGDAAVRQLGKGKRLADAGFGVLLVEYRGYPGSTGEPSEAGLFTDGLAAYDFIRAQSEQPIGLYAHSLGTGVAVKIATERDVFAVVLESPYDSIMAVAQGQIPWLPMSILLKHKFRSDELINTITAPILMLHGNSDRVIPIHHAENLMKQAPAQTEFVVIEKAGHNNLTRFGSIEKALEFFKRQQK